jgi:glucosamine-6-phosphate deaminase
MIDLSSGNVKFDFLRCFRRGNSAASDGTWQVNALLNVENKFYKDADMEVRHAQAERMKVRIYATPEAVGQAAALDVAEELRRLDRPGSEIGVIFATGASQLKTLDALTAMSDLPWERVCGFHMDEYVGIYENHPASFRRYLREKLTDRVPVGKFFQINGSSPDIEQERQEYMRRLCAANPQICLLGIGENGHLAFNDPGEADFEDSEAMKVVTLDAACRRQQLAEGWFKTLDEVPPQALTLTIPTLLKVPKLIISVPGRRKSHSVRRAIEDPISTACPATILRTHPDATMYLDRESASELSLS